MLHVEHAPLTGAKAWAVLLLSSAARAALFVGVALVLWTTLPQAIGMTTTTVMSGSMSPRIAVGDAIVTRPVEAADIKIGQVLLVLDPDLAGALRLHRLHSIKSGQLQLKGDANAQPDSSLVAMKAVKGAAFLRIPFAGMPYLWMRTGQWAAIAALVAVVIGLVLVMRLDRLLYEPTARARRRHRNHRPRASRARGIAAAGIGLIVLATLTVSPASANSSFSGKTASPTNGFGTTCWDVPLRTGIPSGASSYYNYMETTGATTVDRSSSSTTGNLYGSYTHQPGSCAANDSPYLSVNGTGTVVAGGSASSLPANRTLSTWVRVANHYGSGGMVADFGTSANGSASGAGNTANALYMTNAGTMQFANTMVGIAGIQLGTITCTSSTAINDGQWHFVSAVFASTLLSATCTLYVDNATPTPVSTGLSVGLLLPTGYVRFGNDTTSNLPTIPTNAGLVGDLDESSAFSSALNATQETSLYGIGH